jgi:hypothetical protein
MCDISHSGKQENETPGVGGNFCRIEAEILVCEYMQGKVASATGTRSVLHSRREFEGPYW